MRKGVINPEDPTQIIWSEVGNYTDLKGYRMAAVNMNEQAWWIGGSAVTYNYNGIAYNGSGGVPPVTRIFGLSQSEPIPNIYINEGQPYGVMDLRGIAKISENEVVICGGMTAGQEVTNKAFKLTYAAPVDLEDLNEVEFALVSNLLTSGQSLSLKSAVEHDVIYAIYDLSGNLLYRGQLNAGSKQIEVNQESIRPGQYLLVFEQQKALKFGVQ
jgi:hypothetical protein